MTERVAEVLWSRHVCPHWDVPKTWKEAKTVEQRIQSTGVKVSPEEIMLVRCVKYVEETVVKIIEAVDHIEQT